MELTGKAKIKFEKWKQKHRYFIISIEDDFDAIWFNCSNSMKYGVYVDFFDSVGIKLFELPVFSNGKLEKVVIEIYPNRNISTDVTDYFKTRQQAREKAIENVNEILNKI